MDELRIINNLCDQECIRNVAFKGNLICNCQNKLFNVYHSGKKTRGILASYLMKRAKSSVSLTRRLLRFQQKLLPQLLQVRLQS